MREWFEACLTLNRYDHFEWNKRCQHKIGVLVVHADWDTPIWGTCFGNLVLRLVSEADAYSKGNARKLVSPHLTGESTESTQNLVQMKYDRQIWRWRCPTRVSKWFWKVVAFGFEKCLKSCVGGNQNQKRDSPEVIGLRSAGQERRRRESWMRWNSV